MQALKKVPDDALLLSLTKTLIYDGQYYHDYEGASCSLREYFISSCVPDDCNG